MRVLSVSANTEHINMPVFPIGLASADAAEAVEGWLQETVQLWVCKRPNWHT